MSDKLGRPTILSPEMQEAICLAIRTTKLSLADCAESLGIARSTVFDWIARGKTESSGIYRDFAVAVGRARADGSKLLLARIAKAGQEPKHWQANATLLAMTEPQYAPKVRLVVEQELSAAADRLEREFANEPEILQRALGALAADEGG